MVNINPKKPGIIQTFDGQAQLGGVPSAATYSGQAWEALTRVAGGLSDKLGQMADEAVKRESEMAALNYAQGLNGQDNAVSYQQQQAAGVAADAAHGKGPWIEQAKAILRKEEGFRDTPYYDVNAHRVGYGSDTTIVNGKPVRVTPGMKITQDQAEQDLTYRLTSQEGARVASQVGDGWATLPDNVKAGLASVGYNYGSLPAPVVSAARSGDPAKIAAAVAALDANPKRRQREAAIIAGTSTVPAGAPPAATPQFSAGQKMMEPLPLRRDGTIAGEAWDRAVSSAYSWRMQEALSNDLHAAYLQNQDNPQGYASAMADLRAKYQQNPNLNDPYLSETFNRAFTEKSDGYAQAVAAKHEQRLRAEQEASFAAGMESNRVEIEQQAIALGASPQGDAIVGRQVQRAQSALDQAVDAGTITPAFAEAKKKQIAETAIRGRVQGVYEALPTPEAKKQYALKLLEDKVAGKGPLTSVDYATVKALSDTLFNDAQQAQARANTTDAVTKIKVQNLVQDDIKSVGATGKGLDTSTGLDADTVRKTLGDDGLLRWQQGRDLAQKTFSATAGMAAQNEDEIVNHLAIIKPTPGAPGFAEQLAVYDAAVSHARDILAERQKNPLVQAASAGLIHLDPIDASSDQALSQSLSKRREVANVVSAKYGMSVPLFTLDETAGIKGQMLSRDAGTQKLAMTQLDYLAGSDGLMAVKQQFGEQAVQSLQDWQARVRYATPEEGSAWLKERLDPKWEERVRPLVQKGEQLAMKAKPADIVSGIHDSWFSKPDVPADAATQRAMMNDYVTIFGERFAVTQDEAKAKEQTLERLRKVWGTTSVTGSNKLMLYPPEAYYPPVNGKKDYLGAEMADFAKSRNLDAANVALVSDAKTQGAAERGQAPGYLISVVDPKTGFDNILTDEKGAPLRYFFDPKAATEKATAAAQDARMRQNDPWLVLGPDTAIGPFFPSGATDQQLQQTKERTRQIYEQQKQDYQQRKKAHDEIRAILRGQGAQ